MFIPVADPDLQMRGGGEGRGWSQKNCFQSLGPQFDLKIRGGGPPLPSICHCIQGSLTLADSFQSRYTFDHVS